VTRIRSKQPAGVFYERPPLPRKRDFVQHGFGPFTDAYPQPGQAELADWRKILNEQLSRDRNLTDLPDVDPSWFDDALEFEQWEAEGAQRFSA
jgi:hypothetical protein